jgi:phage/plasmid-associated DNA primase
VNLAEHFWEFDAGAVLDWAREGLNELVESNFQYFTPESSREFLREWEKVNDSVSLFLEDCASGEFRLSLLDGAEGRSHELGKVIYKGYLRWAQEAGIRGTVKRTNFYNDLKKKHKYEFQIRGDGGLRFEWKWETEKTETRGVKDAEETSKSEKSNTRFEQIRGEYEVKNEPISGLEY